MVTIPDYSDFDAASTLNAVSAPPTLSPPITTTRAASDGYVDYDTADTVHVIDAGETGVLEP
jgi:hypothetical protein